MARAVATTEEPEAPTRRRRVKAATPVEVTPQEVAAASAPETTNGHRRRGTPMSDAHKEALAEGREQGRAVREYLEALESVQPRRGRPRTPEALQRRLGLIDRQLEGMLDPLSRLNLVQRRMDVLREIEMVSDDRDIAALEEAFIKAAAGYSRRKGITWDAWRTLKVSPDVLRRAGVPRS